MYFRSMLCSIVSPPMHAIWLNLVNKYTQVAMQDSEEEEIRQELEEELELNVKKSRVENVGLDKQVAELLKQLKEKERQVAALYQQKERLCQEKEALHQQLLEKEQDKPIETFYRSLRSEKIQNDILKFQVPRVPEFKMYVRKAYKELHELIHGHYRDDDILVTGNPGVGKSWFCLYELFVLLEKFSASKEMFEYSSIVFESLTFEVFCVFTATGCTSGKAYTNSAIAKVVDGKRAIHLFDCGTKEGEPKRSRQRMIVFSSPDPARNYQVFCKERDPKTLYMPPWTMEELELAKPEGVDVAEKFRIWGGIPRYVFKKNLCEVRLQAAISILDSEKLYEFALDQKMHNAGEVSHQLFHIKVKEGDYTKFNICFASEYVLENIVKQIEFNARSSILRLIDSGECDDSAYLGELFEAFTHYKFREGGTFPMRRLARDREDQVEEQLVLEKPECVVFDNTSKLKKIREEPVYLKPRKKNFESLDSVLLHNGKKIVIQITMNKSHGVKKNGLDAVREALGTSSDDLLTVCFVVPHNIYGSFKKQTYQGTNKQALQCQECQEYEQWVLGIKLIC